MVAPPLGEAREQVEHALDAPAPPPARHGEVLRHGEGAEDVPFLRDEAETGARAAPDRPSPDLGLPEPDAPGVKAGVAHRGDEQRRLAHAVAPEQGRRLAGCEREGDIVEHDRRAVACADALEAQSSAR